MDYDIMKDPNNTLGWTNKGAALHKLGGFMRKL
jgi:hypothetical protein